MLVLEPLKPAALGRDGYIGFDVPREPREQPDDHRQLREALAIGLGHGTGGQRLLSPHDGEDSRLKEVPFVGAVDELVAHALPLGTLLDEAQRAYDAEHRRQLHDAAPGAVWLIGQLELPHHALDEASDFSSTRLRQILEVGRFAHQLATVLLVGADLFLLASRTLRSVRR